jgi:hypothetical protein
MYLWIKEQIYTIEKYGIFDLHMELRSFRNSEVR